MRFLLPFIKNNTFHDGSIIKSMPRCNQKYNCDACAKFYLRINNMPEGFYTCPSGYTVYHHIQNNEHIFFPGLLVKKYYKKQQKISELENIKIITEDFFLDILKEQGKYIELQQDAAFQKEIHRDLLHDIRKLDSLIKAKAESIIYTFDSSNDTYKEIINRVKNIEAMEELISCKYAVYDLVSNINVLTMSSTTEISVYKKFDKVRYILADYRNKGISINFQGETNFTYSVNLVYFELLPFLLLENAVKYSIGQHTVDVTFEEYSDTLHVYINSFGPYCGDDELGKLYEKNYRGKNTSKLSSDGTGIGLFLVKQICVQYNIDIRISSDFIKNYNGIPYGYFKVELIF